jgi:hypothetical protein
MRWRTLDPPSMTDSRKPTQPSAAPRLAVLIIDGLPIGMLERMRGDLPFLRDRTPHQTTAVSCFPSTTGPAYFPFLAGSSPGRANVTGIRWFDREQPTRTRFPHRGLRSYVGPDAGKMTSDTVLRTLFAADAWPASSPVAKDIPKHREKSRDALWAFAHFTERWDLADRRTNWKLGRAMGKGRPVVFAVFPSVDEYGHTLGLEKDGHAERALTAIDAMIERTLDGFAGEVIVSADHGLTATHTHINLRAVVQRLAGPTVAFPLIGKPNPAAVVCESGNAMAHVYLRGPDGWRSRPQTERCRELAGELCGLEGIDSVAIRADAPHSAELFTPAGSGAVGWSPEGFWQRGPVFGASFEQLGPREALGRTLDEEWPDAPFALTALFASQRTGDLLVSAKVGYDLRTEREWPVHNASHGALHRSHTVVPLLSSVPLDRAPRRTIDVFTETVEQAGLDLAGYPQSDAWLMAQGTWAPGVAGADAA